VSLHVIFNAYWEELEFELSPVSDGGRSPWRRWIDTYLDSPHDIVEWEHAPSIPGHRYRARPRSVVVLFAGDEGAHGDAFVRRDPRGVRGPGLTRNSEGGQG
jgi:pullulanase/glycogen debranching enzyme